MPFRWLKPLNCNSNASDDIFLLPKQRPPSSSSSSSSSKHPQNHSPIPNPNPSPKQTPKSPHKIPPFPLPTLSNLPSAHSSRRIIEIIFHSSWLPFPVHIEMLFRIRHSPLAVSAFEARRAAARRRDSVDGRCAADGNEMMRFHASVAGGGVERCKLGKMEGVRTFKGSGGAHESGGGGGSGRRVMMVCRVIVGRVGDPEEIGLGVDSVKVGEEEILVLDARAVLPCFLIIYKV